MFPGMPASSEILCNTVSATGTLITIPAGKWYTGNITVSAAVAALANSNPVVTTAGTNVSPTAGTVIARVNTSGLVAGTAAAAAGTEIIVKAPPENDVTLVFTAGAGGTSSATVNGYVFG